MCQCIDMLSNIIQMADPFGINLLSRITIVVDNIHVQFSWTVKHPIGKIIELSMASGWWIPVLLRICSFSLKYWLLKYCLHSGVWEVHLQLIHLANLVFILWGGLCQGGDSFSSGEAYSDGEGSSGGTRGDFSSESESDSDKRDVNVDFFEEDRSEPRKIDVAAPLYKNPYFQKHGFPPRYEMISQAWFQLLVAINWPTWWILLPSFIHLVISRNSK